MQEKSQYQIWSAQKHSFQTNQLIFQNRKRFRYKNDEHSVPMETDGHPQDLFPESVSEGGNSKGNNNKNINVKHYHIEN